MTKKFKVSFRDIKTMEFEEGTTFKEISEYFKEYFNYDILAAKVDNNIVDLSDSLTKKCNIDFFDRSSDTGNTIYARSARFILVLAIQNVLGKDVDIVTEHSMDHGVYCTIKGSKIDKEIVSKITKEMKKIVKQDYFFTKLSVSRLDAIKYFKKFNKMDKVNVLKYISNIMKNLDYIK